MMQTTFEMMSASEPSEPVDLQREAALDRLVEAVDWRHEPWPAAAEEPRSPLSNWIATEPPLMAALGPWLVADDGGAILASPTAWRPLTPSELAGVPAAAISGGSWQGLRRRLQATPAEVSA